MQRFKDRLLRGVLVLLVRLIYPMQVEGRGHVPRIGGGLLVCNHLSLLDALLVQAASRRPVRFLMFRDYYERPWIRPIAQSLGAIPISSRQRPREMIQSLRTAAEAIRSGELVGIFAEGQITRIGQLLPFRRGFERIMKDQAAPIIPVCLDGVWGSVFSFEAGRFLWKWPRRRRYPVVVKFGPPRPPATSAVEVRRAVQELGTLAWRHRKPSMRPLAQQLLRTARRNLFTRALGDSREPTLRWGGVLVRTLFLAGRLQSVWRGQSRVAILLPPSLGGALVNYAALLLGKAPVNLNYTTSTAALDSCLRQCELDAVVTSRGFLEKLKLEVPARCLFLEELAARPRALERVRAVVLALLAPTRWLVRHLADGRPAGMDDVATVIFSSGSTGDPKGVLLSHYNVVSNIEQMGQVFALDRHERLLGILPLFHSFGFTVTLCLPVVLGAGVVYHPNPLDAEAVGSLVREHAVSFLLATPTFLQLYLRGCEPEDFGSLQFVVAGAEKMPERLALAFEEKFGLRPVEGYGCTECSPAVAVNTRDFRAAGIRQVGTKRGKIGHPLPGISVRIVEPATEAPLPPGVPGLLLVRGPNIMQGYLGRPQQTADVLKDGWYVTGDIAVEDEDGFLQITDRLSRFSKIGGEMVPHVRVEEALHELAGGMEAGFFVCGVPDERKGERLTVLHTLTPERLQAVLARLPASGLPNLWVPRPADFHYVSALPMLGTGKLDLRKAREIAKALTAAD